MYDDDAPMTLAEALSRATVEALRPLAALCAVELPTRKAELIAVITRSLGDDSFLAAQVRLLEERARWALSEAVDSDGRLDGGRFSARYGTTFTLPDSWWSSEGAARQSPDSTRIGLFFPGGRVPRDLLPRLRRLLPPPASYVAPTQDVLPEEMIWPTSRGASASLSVLTTEASAAHDLLATLRVAAQGKLTVGAATHQPSAAAVRLLRARYLLPDVYPAAPGTRADDTIRPFAFSLIAQAAALARVEGTRLRVTQRGEAALEERGAARTAFDPAGLLKTCWTAWLSWPAFDEIARVRGIKGQKAQGQRFTAPARRRAALAAALAACPAGRWMAIADFLRHVRLNYDFRVDASALSHLYVGDYAQDDDLGVETDDPWSVVNAAYTRAFLLEYAATLGVIDVAIVPPNAAPLDFTLYNDRSADAVFSRYQGLCYLRVTPLGAFLLGQSPTYAPPPPVAADPLLRVLPTYDIVITQRAAVLPNDRVLLATIAAQASDDVYTLSRQSLLAAAEQGITPTSAGAFLVRASGAALPATVERLVQDAARSASAVYEAGPAVLVRCAAPQIAQLLSHDPTVGTLCLLAGATHVVVPTADLPAFRRALKRLGYILAGADRRAACGG